MHLTLGLFRWTVLATILSGSVVGVANAEPDYWRVTGVASNDVLNVRTNPSARSNIVGALSEGSIVRNLGCRQEASSRWCRIRLMDEMGGEGWVNARYLRESNPPSSPAAGIGHGGNVRNRCAGAVAGKVGVSANDVIVTSATISEGTGRHVVYVGVPYGKADWVCEADRSGRIINVFYSGE